MKISDFLPGLSWLRLGGAIALALALAGAAWLIRDRFHQKAMADAAERCAVAAGTDNKPLDDCDARLADDIREARQWRICDQALRPGIQSEMRFLASQACGSGVKQVIAARDAAISERDNLNGQLAVAIAGQVRAATRAEARAAKSTERESHARKVIAGAPRDAAGSIHCDAECLRQLGR